MHEFLESPDNVLAVKVSGTITGEDLDAIWDRTDTAMARYDKIHVYAETHGIEGMQLSALPRHLSRALPMFGKLDRFGRVAVVADQAWIRAGTRLEARYCRTSAIACMSPKSAKRRWPGRSAGSRLQLSAHIDGLR